MLISHRPLFRAIAFVALAGCRLDLAGEQVVPVADTPRDSALNPPSVKAADASSVATLDGNLEDRPTHPFIADAGVAFGYDADLVQQGGAGPDAASWTLDGPLTDADLPDVAAVQEGATRDSAPDGQDDGGTSCRHLMLCCSQLVAPIPSALLACIGAQQADGGDAGTCESLLASLHAVGLCP